MGMSQMKKNRNSYTPYSSNSHHGNSNMEKMKMMMGMMKMSNMMNDNQDYSSSSYSNDNDAFDMFSEIFDSSDRMDNYRSSYDNKNQIGSMTCVMRELNVLDASNNIDIQAMKRDTQKYTMPSEWFKTKYEHLLDTCYEM